MSDLDRQATGAPEVPERSEPEECEHGQYYYSDFANQPRALTRCPMCDLDFAKARLRSTEVELSALQEKYNILLGEVGRLTGRA